MGFNFPHYHFLALPLSSFVPIYSPFSPGSPLIRFYSRPLISSAAISSVIDPSSFSCLFFWFSSIALFLPILFILSNSLTLVCFFSHLLFYEYFLLLPPAVPRPLIFVCTSSSFTHLPSLSPHSNPPHPNSLSHPPHSILPSSLLHPLTSSPSSHPLHSTLSSPLHPPTHSTFPHPLPPPK